MAENIQYSPRIINEISELFALKDSTLANYQKGSDLVKLFNSLGYNDAYTFESGIGIKTPDLGEGISRTQYVLKRLEDLNNRFMVPKAIQELISRSKEPEKMVEAFRDLFLQSETMEFIPQVMKTSDYTAKPTPVPSNDEKLKLSKKQLEDKILGEIPSGCPVVFISYSWDSDDHKNWVGQLADDLTEMGTYVLLDQYLEPGTSISDFMELGIERADKVLVIGTEQYKIKSLNISGGAAVEGLIIRNGVLANIGTTKIIPCLRQGTFPTAFPSSISDRKGEVFTDDTQYKKTLDSLWLDINNMPARIRPIIGQVKPTTPPTPTSVSEAATTDFRRDNDVRWLKVLLSNFSFRLMQEYIEEGPYVEPTKVCESFDTWNYVMNQVTFVIYDKELEDRISNLYKLWVEVKSIGVKYYEPMGSDITRFRFSGLKADVFITPEAERDFYAMGKIMMTMKEPLKELAQYVMAKYEINIEELSRMYEFQK